MKRSEVDLNKVTPMMRQYIEIKNMNPDIIILFRLGDFYEMFFEDAITASHELELTLTGKNAGLDEKIPMCGVPHHAANIYIEKLVNKGYRVGICEQLEDPKSVKGIVKRDLVQIISRGTVINNESLNEKENNYIGALIDFNHAYGLAFTDISTGEVGVLLVEHNVTKIISEIINLNIKEVILSSKIDKTITSLLNNQFKVSVSYYDNLNNISKYSHVYNELSDVRHIETIKYLLTYIDDTQKRDLGHFQKAFVKDKKAYLKMDVHTKRNLELVETLRLKERTFSLLWLLDKTKTAMGSRMLKSYIENPIVDKSLLNRRFDIIEKLLSEFILKEELSNYLFEVYDLERLSGRIAFGNANARDLLQLKNSLKVLPNIKEILKKLDYDKTIDELNDLYNLIPEFFLQVRQSSDKNLIR